MTDLQRFYQQKLQEARHRISELESICDELEGSLEYLSDCNGCSSETSIHQCTGCQHEHQRYQDFTLKGGRVDSATDVPTNTLMQTAPTFSSASGSVNPSYSQLNPNDDPPKDPMLVAVVARTVSQGKLSR